MTKDEFRFFFLDNYARACRYAAALAGREQAEDLVQDAFYRIYSRRKKIRSDDAPVTYLFRTLHSICLNRLRRENIWRRIRALLPPRNQKSEAESADIREVWDALSIRERSVFLLVEYLDISSEESAEILGIAPSTLRVFKHRIREKISKWEDAS